MEFVKLAGPAGMFFIMFSLALSLKTSAFKAIVSNPLSFYLGLVLQLIGMPLIGFIIAFFGAGGFLISGSYLEADLPLSIGFLNIPAFLVFFPITAFMARLGAKASHRVDKMRMTKYFGLFLIVIGTRFLYEYFKL